ncbi:MAG TPA: DUF3810 domain-containing protein [Anaerovoracaceae bacterium]|nr:DUF3810 domain-containing protein [Anaerovoracaceae bacterium]
MLKRFSLISTFKNTLFFSGACLFLSLTLILLSRYTEGFAQWYAVHLYPVFPNTIGRIFSAWNFSFFEAGILLSLLLAGFLIFKIVWLLFSRSTFGKTYLSTCLRILICTMSGLVLIYSLTCSINYQRDGIGTVLNLPQEDVSTEKLEKLSLLLVKDLTALTDDPEWDYSILTADDEAYIETEAVNTMKQLGKKEPSLAGYYPKPKPVYFSESLSSLGIEGIFSPFTMEANYNNAMTSFLIPYTICHELAHLKGYMKEDDAGFIAYLSCRNSPSKVFQYSGIFHALIFSLNALKSEAGAEEFNKIYQQLPEPVRIQLSYIKEQNQEHASSYNSITKTVNNLYLLANTQLGTKSYGRMVDLLIADYADRIEAENLI